MTSLFTFPGGASNPISQIITGTGPTVLNLGTANAPGGRNVALFRVSEILGGTPNLTVEIFDATNSYYLGSSGVTYKAKALTAFQSILFDDGYTLPTGWSIRITCSVGSSVNVTGIYVGRQSAPNWKPPS